MGGGDADVVDYPCESQNLSCGVLARDDEPLLSQGESSSAFQGVIGDGASHVTVDKGKESDEEDAETETNDHQTRIIVEREEEIVHQVDAEIDNDAHEDNEHVDDAREELEEFEGVRNDDLGVVGFPNTIGDNTPSFETDIQSSRMYKSLIKNYRLSGNDDDAFEAQKNAILSYQPGEYAVDLQELKLNEREIPEVATLLLVGLRGSGKSTLVNNILRVFRMEDRLTRDASVSYKSSGYGTLFLQEYFVDQQFPKLCIYDSRSLSIDIGDNFENIKGWMTKGVSNAEPVFRASDSPNITMAIQCKGRQLDYMFHKKRAVNFVIFVINGLSVLKAMRNGGKVYLDKLAENFNSPYLSFRDDKPVVVVTHGDLLEVHERASVRMQLGELLGVSPLNIYDIPDSCDLATRLSIVNTLLDALRRVECNLPMKKSKPIHRDWVSDTSISSYKLTFTGNEATNSYSGFGIAVLSLKFLCVVLLLSYLCTLLHRPDEKSDWHKIRHLWLA